MTPREKALEEALRLCDAWLVLPLDRGGKCGPKGRAFDAFLTAKDAALSLPASAGEEASDRREAAKKLLCDVCACAAECGDTLDLPHVLKDCVGPLETLIAERDATLQLLELSRRFMDPSGPFDVPALLSELARAKSRLTELEARPAPAELRERVARAICKTDRFDTGEGTCAALCMEQLGDPRRKGCGHALRVHGTLVDAILAALPELAGGVPAGWKLVPEEPTEEMVCAGDRKDPGSGFGSLSARIYRAMLAAAPPASGSAS
jgi:hypothetical protein